VRRNSGGKPLIDRNVQPICSGPDEWVSLFSRQSIANRGLSVAGSTGNILPPCGKATPLENGIPEQRKQVTARDIDDLCRD
jgi:hypothetical protein